ncbi:hypothetical protein DFH27DRAFT_565521 [Peziza echinospora]|nr:hypothetical protein DFH27DRAFT_565521 [Peziza echinospora]
MFIVIVSHTYPSMHIVLELQCIISYNYLTYLIDYIPYLSVAYRIIYTYLPYFTLLTYIVPTVLPSDNHAGTFFFFFFGPLEALISTRDVSCCIAIAWVPHITHIPRYLNYITFKILFLPTCSCCIPSIPRLLSNVCLLLQDVRVVTLPFH